MDRYSNFQDQDDSEMHICLFYILVAPKICLFLTSCITVSDFASAVSTSCKLSSRTFSQS